MSSEEKEPEVENAVNKDDEIENFVVLETLGTPFRGLFTFALDESFNDNTHKFMIKCKRVRWLLICLENHLTLLKYMDDALGIRLVAMVARDPLEMFKFEFDNYSKIARSGAPMKIDGLRKPYLENENKVLDLIVNHLTVKTNHLTKVLSNIKGEAQVEKIPIFNSFRVLTGTDPGLHRNVAITRWFCKSEEATWPRPVDGETRLYAVWIGPLQSGNYRQYRLELTNLHNPLCLELLQKDQEEISHLVRYLMFTIKEFSVSDSLGQHDALMVSISPSNAPFLLSSLLSPYQSIERFVFENLESFEPWTQEFNLRNSSLRMGETSIVRMSQCERLFWKPENEGHIEKRKKELNDWLTNSETLVSAQYALILQIRTFICFGMAKHLNSKIVYEFKEMITTAFSIAQYIEKSTERYSGSFPGALKLLADTFSHLEIKNNAKVFVEECCTDRAPMAVCIAYLDLFVFKSQKKAEKRDWSTFQYSRICEAVKRNGLMIKRQYLKIPEKYRNATFQKKM